MKSEIEESAETALELMEDLEAGKESGWMGLIAVSTLVMALLSALGALLAGINANESILERTEEIIEISRKETEFLSIELLESKHEILNSLGTAPDSAEVERVRKERSEFEAERKKIMTDEGEVEAHIYEHEIFAGGVTLLSIAITLGGLALLAKRKIFWMIGLGFGITGTVLLALGIYSMFSP